MEADGLLAGRRDPENRRIHHVELTDAGEGVFQRLRRAATMFDQRLRQGLDDNDLNQLAPLLDRLHANATSDEQHS